MPIQHDDDWDNRKALPDCQKWYANCHQHSLSFSRSVHIYMDNVYGAKPRNRIDILPGEPNVIGVLLISGIYDLRPITQIYVNDILSMDEEMAKRNSPALDPKRYSSFSLIDYGEQELTAFQQQSRDYHKILTNEGVDAALLPVSNRNHFNVLDELINEDGAIFRALINWVNLA